MSDRELQKRREDEEYEEMRRAALREEQMTLLIGRSPTPGSSSSFDERASNFSMRSSVAEYDMVNNA